MHSIAIVAETRGITVDADALREEVLEEAPRALAAAPNAAEQLEKLEVELARLQQLCDTQEGELTIYKMTEAASSTRLEGACKMIEQASARMQALENDKVRLEGELRASEEQRKTFETTIKAALLLSYVRWQKLSLKSSCRQNRNLQRIQSLPMQTQCLLKVPARHDE